VTIPGSVTSIGSNAFSGCAKLKSAIFEGGAPSLGAGAFSSVAGGFTVYYFNGAMGFSGSTWNGLPAVNMGAFSPIAPWLVSAGYAYNANLQGTPNGDGVSLLTDYALNLDPTRSESGSLPKPVVAGNQLSITYYSGSAGVTYTVQTSTDLKAWGTAGIVISGPDANNFSTATVTSPGPACFLRLVTSY